MSPMPRLVAHTALLTAASLVMRTISVSFGIFLTNLIGAAAIGQYQLVMTLYGLFITLCCSGVRLACTRLCAEARGDAARLGAVVRFCVLWGFCAGAAAAAMLFWAAPWAAARWLGQPALSTALRVLAPGLPALTASSAIAGYFTAQRQIARQSALALLELLAQISLSVLALRAMGTATAAQSCAAVAAGITASEYVGLAGCLLALRLPAAPARRAGPLLAPAGKFLSIAMPVLAGALLCSGLRTAEQLMVPAGLRSFGLDSERALALYGMVHGMVLPVLFYPAAILTSLSGLLIPELGEYRVRGHQTRIGSVVSSTLRLTALFSIAVAGMALAFSREIALAVYHSDETAGLIALFAPLIPLVYLDLVADGMLKGLDQQLRQVLYSALDALLCVALVSLLLPRMGLFGYVVTIFAAKAVNTLLSLLRLVRVTAVRVDLAGTLLRPALCIAAAAALTGLVPAWPGGAAAGLSLRVGLCLVLYLLFLRVKIKKLPVRRRLARQSA